MDVGRPYNLLPLV